MLKVGIINITGYAGMELARILHTHQGAEVVSVTGRSAAGENLATVLPHLFKTNIEIGEEITESVDVIFSALPQVASAIACVPYVRSGVKVIDISADFRLHDPDNYAYWYGTDHPAPDLLETAVYGLTELNRSRISAGSLIANPGCYPTAALLALAPLVENQLVSPNIIVDCKSGVSGAGRGLSMTTHFSEVNENVFAYGIDGHRHLPEITQELERMKPGFAPQVIFQPHLIPMTRGILDTIYADFAGDRLSSDAIRELFREFYRNEPFVRVVDSAPQTKQTWCNNDCLIYPTVDTRTGRIMVFAVLDNLVKGAAGQAVQNMNLMFGLPETEGLEQLAMYP